MRKLALRMELEESFVKLRGHASQKTSQFYYELFLSYILINAKYRLQSLRIASKHILFHIVFHTKRTKKRYLLR